MRKLLPTALLGVAGMTAAGLVAMSTPTLSSASDEAAKREDDVAELVLVADDDDDDTNDDDDDTRTNSQVYAGRGEGRITGSASAYSGPKAAPSACWKRVGISCAGLVDGLGTGSRLGPRWRKPLNCTAGPRRDGETTRSLDSTKEPTRAWRRRTT